MSVELMNHQPVMVNEILSHVRSTPEWMFDATFGCGGHSQAFQNQWPHLKIIAFDQDIQAYQWGKEKFKKKKHLFLYHKSFHYFYKIQSSLFQSHSIQEGFDIVLLDLGISSPQLEDAERGFSFYQNGPLDMRMNATPSHSFSASIIVNQWNADELSHLFQTKGEIRHPTPVVQAILQHRKKKPIQQTAVLSHLIEKTIGWKKKGKHPATAYFLALRLQVNNELEGLQESLPYLLQALRHKGRMFVLSFHSLEDRIVKKIFKQAYLKKEGILVNKKVIRPSRDEVLENPRSRSAKLRVFEVHKKGDLARDVDAE